VMKIINREVVTGLLNGLVFAVITGVFVYFWFHDLKISILIVRAGLKTGIYYLRRKPRHIPQQFTIEPTQIPEADCLMCSG